jgi:hypothetical protein
MYVQPLTHNPNHADLQCSLRSLSPLRSLRSHTVAINYEGKLSEPGTNVNKIYSKSKRWKERRPDILEAMQYGRERAGRAGRSERGGASERSERAGASGGERASEQGRASERAGASERASERAK